MINHVKTKSLLFFLLLLVMGVVAYLAYLYIFAIINVYVFVMTIMSLGLS